MGLIIFYGCIAVVAVTLLYSLYSLLFVRNGQSAAQSDVDKPSIADTIEGDDALATGKSMIQLIIDILFKMPGLVVARTVATDIPVLRFIAPIAATAAAYVGSTMAYDTFGAMGPLVYIPLGVLALLSVYYGGQGRHKQLALLTFWCAPVTAQLVASSTDHTFWIAIVINAAFAVGWLVEFAKVVKKTYLEKS